MTSLPDDRSAGDFNSVTVDRPMPSSCAPSADAVVGQTPHAAQAMYPRIEPEMLEKQSLCRDDRRSGRLQECNARSSPSWQAAVTTLAGRLLSSFEQLVQVFPLVHQVADLPHQGLVAIDDRLRGVAVVVEAGAAIAGLESLIACLARRRCGPRARRSAPARAFSARSRRRASICAWRFASRPRASRAALAGAAACGRGSRPAVARPSRLAASRGRRRPRFGACGAFAARPRRRRSGRRSPRALLAPQELFVAPGIACSASPPPTSMILVASCSTK